MECCMQTCSRADHGISFLRRCSRHRRMPTSSTKQQRQLMCALGKVMSRPVAWLFLQVRVRISASSVVAVNHAREFQRPGLQRLLVPLASDFLVCSESFASSAEPSLSENYEPMIRKAAGHSTSQHYPFTILTFCEVLPITAPQQLAVQVP